MRKVLTAVAVGALSGTAMLAIAAGPNDNRVEGKAYINFDFGGNRPVPKNFHYGMRLDYDQRFVSSSLPLAPIAALDFNKRGFDMARLNGMPVVYRTYRLNEGETTPATTETVPVDSGTAGADAGASAGAASGGAAAASGYTVADWGLIALGAVGVGYAGYEVAKSDDNGTASSSGGSTAGGSTAGGSTTGGSTTGGSTTGGSTTGGLLGGLLGLAELDRLGGDERVTREYQEWLDGGTGQMGDLSAR